MPDIDSKQTAPPDTSLPGRVVRVLRTRGWRHVLRALRRRVSIATSKIADARFDARFGTDTAGVVETRDQRDVESPNLAGGIRYEPTRAQPFRRLLRAAAIPATGTFVDLGCGKGRTLLLAAMAGFPKVVGVDYSPALCDIARRNLDILRARGGPSRFESRVLAADVVDYVFTGDETVVYFFNPFGEMVLRAAIAALQKSLVEHPRTVWLVYHNPVWRRAVDETPGWEHTGDYSFGGCDFVVYRSRTR